MRFHWWFIIVFFLVASVSSATFFLIQRKSFSSQDVHVVVENADNIASGSHATLQVGIENDTNVPLDNVNLAVSLPDFMTIEGGSMHFINLHWDNVGANGKIVKGVSVAVAPNATQGTVSGQADYSPQGFVGRFVASQDFPITPSPLGITSLFDLPSSAVSGQEIDGTLHVIPSDALAINDLWIEFVAPSGFQLEEVSPQFDSPSAGSGQASSRWRVEGIQKGSEYTFRFRGVLHGSAGDEENFQALFEQQKDGSFATLAQNTSSVHISQTVLAVRQTIDVLPPSSVSSSITNSGSSSSGQSSIQNNVVQPGAALTVHLTYQNKSDVALEDVSLSDMLTGTGWDFASITPQTSQNGSLETSAAAGTVRWDKSSIPAFALLRPGDSGEVVFQVSVKNDLLPTNTQDTSQTLTSDARISSPHQSLALGGAAFQGEDAQTLKIQGSLSLFSSATIISSSSQGTIYTVTWEARTTINGVSSARVQASLAPGAVWQNAFTPPDALLSYSDNSRTLVWNVGDLPIGTGIIASPQKVSFRVLISSPNHANVQQIFTDQLIEGNNDFIGTQMKKDAGALSTPGF